MPRAAAEDRRSTLGEAPSQVQVTVLRHPAGLTARSWLGAARWALRPRVVVTLGAILIVAGATIGTTRMIGAAGAVAQFPVRCVSLTIALHDPRFMRPDFDRALPCERPGVRYANARTTRSQ